MKDKYLVAGIGELLWDVLPSGRQLGGAPCNFTYHAIQAGCEGFVLSAIGKDQSGKDIKDALLKLDLNIKYVQENEFPTGTVTVRLDEYGHPDYYIHEEVAWDYIRWTSEMEDLAVEIDAVCFGSLAQRNSHSEKTIQAFLKAVRPDCLKVCDINLRQSFFTPEIVNTSIELSDVLKLNEDELPVIAGYSGYKGTAENQMKRLADKYNLKYIIYTMGSKGSIIYDQHETSVIEAPVIQVSDTVGAGDSFTAIFVTGILKGMPLKEIHKKATEVSAYVCTQKGATPKMIRQVF